MTTQKTNRQDGDHTAEMSVLRSLRLLMPQRTLSYSEALQRTELQAGRLLALHGITAGPVPMEIITEQPRIRIERAYDLPVSGSAAWDGARWVITLNASEFDPRQRFSLFHEYAHIVQHPTRHLIVGDGQLNGDDMAERLADYFAACVLMPKAWVKSAYFGGMQKIEALARMFDVSARAMSVRLQQLGLVEPVGRHLSGRAVRDGSTSRRRPLYFRSLSVTPSKVAA